ncbi:TPA: PD-(D/E)XK nuclease family protein [Mannheimia haemolytica]
MNNQDIQQSLNLLRELYKKDQEWLAEQKKSEIYNANRFNPFRFLRKDELGLSAILAFFLNPKETHGQGDVFLNSFLKKLKLHHFLSYDDVYVNVEKSIDDKRRQDIFLQGILKGKLQWVFAIENKLNWAVELPDQIADYLSYLENYKLGSNYFLMFLPVKSYTPKSIDATLWEKAVENKNAIVWDANLIIEWLEEVTVISPEIQSFIRFFIKYLKENVMNQNINSSLLAKEIVKESQLIKMSVDILNSKNDILQLLMLELQNRLAEKFYSSFSKDKWMAEFTQYNMENRSFPILSFQRKDKWQEFSIKIQFNNPNFNGLFFGLDCHNLVNKTYYEECIFNKLDKIDELKICNLSSNRFDDNWTYWKYFGEHLKNWNSETWAKIPSGQLADEIWQEIEPLCRAVTQLNYP